MLHSDMKVTMNKARVAEAARGMIQLKLRPAPLFLGNESKNALSEKSGAGLNGDMFAQADMDNGATSYRCARLVRFALRNRLQRSRRKSESFSWIRFLLPMRKAFVVPDFCLSYASFSAIIARYGVRVGR